MSRSEFYRLVSGAIKRAVLKRAAATTDYPVEHATIKCIVLELERTFAEHNSKFDSERFRRDCGIS